MEKKMLRAVCEAYPDAIGKGRVLEQIGYVAGGAASRAFAKITRLGYVSADGRGALKAAVQLFG